jgi:hypothetical protein
MSPFLPLGGSTFKFTLTVSNLGNAKTETVSVALPFLPVQVAV